MKTYMCYGCKIPCKLLCNNEYAPCFCQYTGKVCKWEEKREIKSIIEDFKIKRLFLRLDFPSDIYDNGWSFS